MSYVQYKQGLVMQVPFQDEQITDSILYPYHICDFPALLMMATLVTVLMFYMYVCFFSFHFSLFSLIHSFDLSSCWIFYSGTLSGTMSGFANSLPLTRHIKWNTHISFKWRYFHILLCSGVFLCLIFNGGWNWPSQFAMQCKLCIFHRTTKKKKGKNTDDTWAPLTCPMDLFR